jgi:uncharacterized protein YecE (DUF72 family)
VLAIGTSGWQYRDWRGVLYPPDVPTSRWLEHYARSFPTVEANSPFYRLPERETFARWAASTPASFVFAVKASRFLTHVKRLRDPEEPVARLLEHAGGLGPKLGPVLLQLPPTLAVDVPRLEATLAAFPRSVRVAFEARHDSWHTAAVYEALAARDCALCLWDRRGRHGPLLRTATWCYVRLHEGRATPSPCYGRRALTTWAERVAEHWGARADGFVFFNNDHRGCAVRDATTFTRVARHSGLRVHSDAARARR